MPTYPLLGTGAWMRMRLAERAKARSSARAAILLTRTRICLQDLIYRRQNPFPDLPVKDGDKRLSGGQGARWRMFCGGPHLEGSEALVKAWLPGWSSFPPPACIPGVLQSSEQWRNPTE